MEWTQGSTLKSIIVMFYVFIYTPCFIEFLLSAFKSIVGTTIDLNALLTKNALLTTLLTTINPSRLQVTSTLRIPYSN